MPRKCSRSVLTALMLVVLGALTACAAATTAPIPAVPTVVVSATAVVTPAAVAGATLVPQTAVVTAVAAASATSASPATATNAPRPTETRAAKAEPTVTPVPLKPAARRPLGIYAKSDISEFINVQQKENHSITHAELDAKFVSLYQSLLANPAIAGLTVGVHWGQVNPNAPSSPQPYNWGYLDDAFNQVSLWNAKNPTQAPKTVQLIVTEGFNSPQWVLDQIPSCDGLFQSPPQNAVSNCGKVTFAGFEESSDGMVLPLPWNAVYKSTFRTFLTALAARYESNPAFVSIAIGGPTAASTEMILPRNGNTPNQSQFGGIAPDDIWLKLLALAYPNQAAYQKSDQAFIDEWDAAIDMYGQVFSGVTLVASPDTGGLPNFSQKYPSPPPSDKLFSDGDCPEPDMDCAAVTLILSHFMDPTVGGANAKATQTGGMKAYNPKANLGIDGVKLLSRLTAALAPSAQILGGEQFDHSFAINPSEEGCPAKECPNTISPEQAQYNVLKVFFDGTAAASSFGGTPANAPLNYLQDYYEDVQYATEHVNAPEQVVQTDGTSRRMTAQDLFNLASQKLLQIAEINRAP